MAEIIGKSGTNYKLRGYFENSSELEPYQGVYVVYDKYNGNYKPIDIGESGIAKEITGTQWNGKLFFGVKK